MKRVNNELAMDTCYRCGAPGYKTNGESQVICEKLAFAGSCEGLKPRRVQPKMGRNQLCSCGSGKKYKRCCNAPASEDAAITPYLNNGLLPKPVENLRKAIDDKIVEEVINENL